MYFLFSKTLLELCFFFQNAQLGVDNKDGKIVFKIPSQGLLRHLDLFSLKE
jgi:hypothetical protein